MIWQWFGHVLFVAGHELSKACPRVDNVQWYAQGMASLILGMLWETPRCMICLSLGHHDIIDTN